MQTEATGTNVAHDKTDTGFFIHWLSTNIALSQLESDAESPPALGNNRAQTPVAADQAWLLFFPPLSALLPLSSVAEYQGTFQSCFHFGDSYRMEQAPVGGVNVPAEPHHAYGQHQQNGFHASTGNAGASGLGGCWRSDQSARQSGL